MTIHQIFKANSSFFLSHSFSHSPCVWLEVFLGEWEIVFGVICLLMNIYTILQNIGMSLKLCLEVIVLTNLLLILMTMNWNQRQFDQICFCFDDHSSKSVAIWPTVFWFWWPFIKISCNLTNLFLILMTIHQNLLQFDSNIAPKPLVRLG